MSGEGVHRDRPADPSADAVAALTMALGAYLGELDDDRRTCLRHAATAIVSATPAGLRITRLFPRSRAATAQVRRAAGQLPDWRLSPFWAAHRRRWEAIAREPPEGTDGRVLFTRGLSWEGRPALVRAAAVEPGRLEVDLLLPCLGPGLWELPLRTAATGLQCHEHLLPARVVRPLPRPAPLPPGHSSLTQFLTRATPQELYASQCFPHPGAEQ
jgi:hypothetical protein